MDAMKTRALGVQSVGVFVSLVVLVVGLGAYLALTPGSASPGTQSSSTTTGGQAIKGIVTGYVTVGPSQPVCSENRSCNVDLGGYSIEFSPRCVTPAATCQVEMAPLSPSGHYSILLSPGEYNVIGLNPSCKWVGCSSAFPQAVTVEGGMQLVLNVNIDTGIR